MQSMLLFLLPVRLLLPYMWSPLWRTWNSLWVWAREVPIGATNWRLIPSLIQRSRRVTCHHEIAGDWSSHNGRRNCYDESRGRRKKGVKLSCHENLVGRLGRNNGATICYPYYWHFQEAHCSEVEPPKAWTIRTTHARKGDWRLEETQ